MALSPEDAEALLEALDSGQLSPDEQEQAASLLDAFASGDPEQEAMDARQAQMRSLDRNVLTGLAQIPLSLGAAVTGGLEAVGALPEGKFDYYQAARRDISNKLLGGEKPRPWVQKGAEFLGSLPIGAAGKAGTVVGALRTAAGNALVGSASGIDRNATAAEAAQSGALGMLIGTAIPGGLSVADWSRTAIPKFWLSHINKAADAEQQASVQELLSQFPQLNDWLTLGQRSGSQATLQTEARLAGNYALEAYKKQAEILRDGLKQYGERYGAQWDDTLQGVTKLSGGRAQLAIRSARKDLAEIRSIEYNSMMDAAEAAVTAEKISIPGVRGSAQIPIDMSTFRGRLVDLMEEYKVDRTKLAPEPAKMLREMEAFKGNLSLETFVANLKAMTAEGKAPAVGFNTADEARAFADRYKDLMFSTVDELDNSHDAFAWIKRARQSYAERSGQFDALGQSAVAKALGLDVQQMDPGQALMAFINKGRAEQQQLREVLQEYDPQMLNEVRGLVWKEAIRTAERQSGGMTKASFDPLKAADNLMQLVGTKGDEFEGLFSRAEADQIRAAVSNIRAIDVRLRGMGQAAEPEKVAMTAANWGTAASRPFLLQQLWRFVTRNKVERMLFTPEGRDMLKNAVDTKDFPKLSQVLARGMASSYGSLVATAPPEELDIYADDGTDSQ